MESYSFHKRKLIPPVNTWVCGDSKTGDMQIVTAFSMTAVVEALTFPGGICIYDGVGISIVSARNHWPVKVGDNILQPIARPFSTATGPRLILIKFNARPHRCPDQVQYRLRYGLPSRRHECLTSLLGRMHTCAQTILPDMVRDLNYAPMEKWQQLVQNNTSRPRQKTPRHCRDPVQARSRVSYR